MPNNFSPRALVDVVGARAKELRVEHDGDKMDVHKWHAEIDMLKPEPTKQFLEHYSKTDGLPAVIDGVEEYRSSDGADE